MHDGPRGVVLRASGLRHRCVGRAGAALRLPPDPRPGGSGRASSRSVTRARSPSSATVRCWVSGRTRRRPTRRMTKDGFVLTRRHRPARRQRLPLRPRPQGRHDHLGRVQHLAGRARERHPRPPAVVEVAVFAIPDERWGETPLAVCVVVPDDGRVRARTRSSTVPRRGSGSYKKPSKVVFQMEPLPSRRSASCSARCSASRTGPASIAGGRRLECRRSLRSRAPADIAQRIQRDAGRMVAAAPRTA